MTTIAPVYVQSQPQTQSKHKIARHLLNVGVTAAGVGATAYAVRKDCIGNLLDSNNVVAKNVVKVFSKIGEKCMKPFEEILKMPLEKRGLDAKEISAALKTSKTGAAMFVTLSAIGLGFLARGIYNAGKINAA